MLLRGLMQGSAVALVLMTSSWARAQCTMDTECKGDRVCEAGKCVAPPPSAAPVPAQPAATGGAPTTARAPVPVAAVVPVLPPAQAPSEPRKMRRHSTGMMVGGIVMTSLAPVALMVAGVYGLGSAVCGGGSRSECDGYATTAKVSLLSALVLAGVGVPLIVVGGTKEPVTDEASATLSPWATPTAAGLALRLTL